MKRHFSTKCVFIDNGTDSQTGAINPPIYQSASFSHQKPEELESIFHGKEYGHVYSRISNPTISELERRIAYLESGIGVVAVSSGMSAIFAMCMVFAQQSSNIVVSNSLFGGTRDLFEESVPKLGIEVRFVDISDLDNVSNAIDENTCFIFSEIISNPKLIVPNIKGLKQLSHQHNIPLVIDATLTSSVGFRAKDHGVDIVIYSSTKLFSANTGAIGGLVVDTGNYDWRKSMNIEIKASSDNVQRFAFLERVRRHGLNNIGLNTSPMNAYFTMIGLETLSLRYQKISDNAQKIAEFFESEEINVNYPGLSTHLQHHHATDYLCDGFGSLLTIDLKTKETAFRFISKLKIAQNMSNLGDNRTMVIHPKSTIYAKQSTAQCEEAGVTDGLIRVNIGIEDVNDLVNEFKEALS